MAETSPQITMEDLPDEMLDEIFSHLKFYGNLRLCLVNKRFLRLVNKNIKYMRRVMCHISESVIETGLTLMRNYRNVSFWGDYDCEQHNYKLEHFKKVEKVEFHDCVFENFSVFEDTLAFYNNAKAFEFDGLIIGGEILKEDRLPVVKCVVDCKLYQTNWKVLSCFNTLSNLQIKRSNPKCFDADNKLQITSEEQSAIIVQHQAYLKRLDFIYESTTSSRAILTTLTTCDHLKLNSFSLRQLSPVDSDSLCDFFKAQHEYITDLKLGSIMSLDILNMISQHLPRLEKLSCTATDTSAYFDQLSSLDKLKSLELIMHGTFDGEIRISELLLEELKVIFGSPVELKMFKKNIPHLKRLTLQCLRNSRTPIDEKLNSDYQEAINHILRLVPQLKSLTVINLDDEMDAPEKTLIKIEDLPLLSGLTLSCRFFVEDYLCSLKLTYLSELRLSNKITDSCYNSKFKKEGLRKMSINCPKLQRIEVFDGKRTVQLIARRNKTTNLLKNMKDLGDNWESECFDYDSRESCSDDE